MNRGYFLPILLIAYFKLIFLFFEVYFWIFFFAAMLKKIYDFTQSTYIYTSIFF